MLKSAVARITCQNEKQVSPIEMGLRNMVNGTCKRVWACCAGDA